MDDSNPELGPFANLYEEWVLARRTKRAPALAERLAATCREAWRNDASLDRVYILYFVYDRKDQGCADLIIEGLKSTDAEVAQRAATIVSVSRGGVLDFGPELRKSYRALVRRFPENDTVRPRELYGHDESDDDDSEDRPFVNLYEEWMSDEYPRNTALARRLADTYREAWATGDSIDRAFVLHFLLKNSSPEDAANSVDGADLVVEALKTEDPRLAPTAAFAAWCFLEDGVHLGPDTREILDAHRGRFPETSGKIWGALRALDELEKLQPERR